MRRFAKLRKDEAGYALVWVLLVLIVAGLVLVPLLLLMGASLTSSHVHEESTQRFYAADAGIEDGTYKVLNEEDLIPDWPAVGESYPYLLAVEINGSSVAVEIYREEEATYKITSTATDNGKNTSIESYVSRLDLTLFFDSAITSLNNINLQPGTIVDGDVTCGGILTGGGDVAEGNEVTEGAEIDWPTAEQISEFLRAQVAGLVPFPDAVIDVDDIPDIGGIRGIGPLYRDGSLAINNSDNNAWTVTLQGTVYVTGDLLIGKTMKEFTLDLNGHTIYVDSEDDTAAIHIGGQCTLTGSGAIIARGGIYFAPKLSTSASDYIFLISIEGKVNFQPHGDYFGSVAGDLVNMQPGGDFLDPGTGGDELNFPGGAAEVLTYTIE